MMRLDLNLATRVYLDRRKVNLALGGAILLLLILLFAGVALISSTAGNIERIRRETADLDKRIAGTTGAVSDKELKETLSRIKSVNGIIDRKTLNWVGLLDRLEVILPDGVSVTSIDPDFSKNMLKLSLVSRNFPLLRRALENMEGSKFFTDVFLLSQSEVTFSETQKGIAFSVSCRLDYRKL
jgi:type IV pilus assembly protein PilN